jgi:hypothetical protein
MLLPERYERRGEMDLIEQLQEIGKRAVRYKDTLATEAQAKQTLVEPFIEALGYDVRDPMQVRTEFIADIGVKKGEKVDYAILKDGEPVILFECKKCGTDLGREHASQLHRYFHNTTAKIAVLTDGVKYWFHTDLDEMNKMDQKPFMELDLLNIQEALVPELKKMSRSGMDVESVRGVAENLKYTREIKRLLDEQLGSPQDEFLEFFYRNAYGRLKTSKRLEWFRNIAKKAFEEYQDESFDNRMRELTATRKKEQAEQQEKATQDEEEPPTEEKAKVVTTEEEIVGYHIVKALLSGVVDPERVTGRDTVKYFGILLDDNNRKPICRLYFNWKQKFVAFLDENRKEQREAINGPYDLLKYPNRLKETMARYEQKGA